MAKPWDGYLRAGPGREQRLLHVSQPSRRSRTFTCVTMLAPGLAAEKRGFADMIRRLGAATAWSRPTPAPTFLCPAPLETAAQAMEGLTSAEMRKVISGDAAKLYKIAPP